MSYSKQYWDSLTPTQQAWFTLAEGEELQDFFVGNMSDEVVSITYGGTTYNATTVDNLIANNSAVFNKLRNDNGQMDLIMKTSTTAGNILGSFKATVTGLPYNMMSQPITGYVGPQPIPPTRCPLCP